jgi:CRISPR-associated endonuclease/helicase Cas3
LLELFCEAVMTEAEFAAVFKALTENAPFPWQWDLFDRWFSNGNFPKSCSIPTGLGKTSIIAIWLIALAKCKVRIPRRLVYVVNRRTVVDQTTDEVKKLRNNLREAGVFDALANLCALPLEPDEPPLALSTLRGAFADNREWSADPARPAVISGTVDMIGSRLLFGGYGVGFKGKPLHAGFLGQDVLLVHDEAHLEPAFQDLVTAIENEQNRCNDSLKLKVIELTATSRGGQASANGETFELSEREKNPPVNIPERSNEPLHVLWRRLHAAKAIHFVSVDDERSKLAGKIGDLVLDPRLKESRSAVLVFARTVENVEKVVARLHKEKQRVQQLTGTLRGLERDRLPADPIFRRFLPNAKDDETTVYLVCTSAGEVGVNISADHLVCDLTTFESMAQRFGRVNRFGNCSDTEIHIVHPDEFDEDDEYDQRRKNTLSLLRQLNNDGSPAALGRLDGEGRKAAFAPKPVVLPVSDILFDCWSLTTIRQKYPGRPPVEPFLHGMEDEKQAQTHIAWREEVWELRHEPTMEKERQNYEDFAAQLLEDFPLKPHELLRDSTYRKNTGVRDRLATAAARHLEYPVWIQEPGGTVAVKSFAELPELPLAGRTVILPPEAGGLTIENGNSLGTFDGSEFQSQHRHLYDVADEWRDERDNQRRVRVWDDDPQFDEKIKGMRLIRTIDTDPDAEEEARGKTSARRYWHWYVRPRSADDDGSKTSLAPVRWHDHTDQVTCNAERIARALDLANDLQHAIRVAARFHDLGKKRLLWQRSIGNPDPTNWLAKSGRDMRPIESTDYRHEFGSLVDVHALFDFQHDADFQALDDPMKDLVLHLIAAHHGRARPHFPREEIFDEEPKGQDITAIAMEVARRFARLQRTYGRWGLAYLESILRAADYAASAAPANLEGGK